MNKEIWGDISNHKYLSVSNHGRVKAIERVIVRSNGHMYKAAGTYLSQSNDKDGYKIIGYRSDKKKFTLRVHRLVAMAFIKNPKNKPCVNHVDCNRANNALANLEWCTVRENVEHTVKLGRNKGGSSPCESNPNSKLNWGSVKKIRELYKNNMRQVEIASLFGVKQAQISRIVRYESWIGEEYD